MFTGLAPINLLSQSVQHQWNIGANQRTPAGADTSQICYCGNCCHCHHRHQSMKVRMSFCCCFTGGKTNLSLATIPIIHERISVEVHMCFCICTIRSPTNCSSLMEIRYISTGAYERNSFTCIHRHKVMHAGVSTWVTCSGMQRGNSKMSKSLFCRIDRRFRRQPCSVESRRRNAQTVVGHCNLFHLWFV